jgi:hypothetical protein
MINYRQRFFVYLRSLALCLAVAGATGSLHAASPPLKTDVPPTKIGVPAAKISVPTAPIAVVAPFTADIAASAKRQGGVSAGGLNWLCQDARCVASGAQTLFSIDSCRALARAAGQIRSFASAKRALSAVELSQCNLGIGAGAAASIGTLKAPVPGLPSTLPSPIPPQKPALLPGSDVAKFARISANLLRINDSAGPVVNVPAGHPVRAGWEGTRAFVEPLGETLIEHWLVVSDSRPLPVNSCEVADGISLPDAPGIVGDGRSVSSTTGSGLSGLVAGHIYYVKLCMKTSRPGTTPQGVWRHESQQVTLNYASALATRGGGDGSMPVAPSPETAPDLAIRELILSRDPGGGAGQLVMQFIDGRGREHFGALYDELRSVRVRAGQPAQPEDIYPFRYAVYVDGALIPQASGQSYLQRSGRQVVITDRYWLPGDRRSHQVRVAVTPVYADYNPGNNERTANLTTEARRDASIALTAEALGSVFTIDTPGHSAIADYFHDHTKLIAAPGIDVAGFFYAVKTTRGPISSGQCVASRGINVTVAGTIGSTALRSVAVEYGPGAAHRQERTIRGRTRIDGVWHEAGAPYEILNDLFTLDMQSLVTGNDRTIPVRAIVTDVEGREYIKDLSFILGGNYFTPASDFMSLTVNEVFTTIGGTSSSSTASRGASAITIDGGSQSLILKGRVRLNPNNCLLRDTRIERFILGVRSTRTYAHGMSINVSNVYGHTIAHTGAETTFLGDFNIRNGMNTPPGSYELVFGFAFNNLKPVLPQESVVGYSTSPRMMVTVR